MTGSDKQQLSDICSLLCATLQSLLRKVSKEDARSISDKVVEGMICMLAIPGSQGSTGGGGLQEDAIITIGVLVDGKEPLPSHLVLLSPRYSFQFWERSSSSTWKS